MFLAPVVEIYTTLQGNWGVILEAGEQAPSAMSLPTRGEGPSLVQTPFTSATSLGSGSSRSEHKSKGEISVREGVFYFVGLFFFLSFSFSFIWCVFLRSVLKTFYSALKRGFLHGVANSQYSVQMMHCRIVCLKLV